MVRKQEIYFVTDVEADGPVPGLNSMLSFASVPVIIENGVPEVMDTFFAANLLPLPTAHPDPATWVEFWAKNPDALATVSTGREDPEMAIHTYSAWIDGFHAHPVFVGMPSAWDFSFVYHYLVRFTGFSPFSHAALDMKTFAFALLGEEYRRSGKRNWPKSWFDPSLGHTHVALDDAREQAYTFARMLAHREAVLSSTNLASMARALGAVG